jgi:D-alanyl-D-alanine carboxypeptidase (penicillin-binding protein 5/6)
MYSQRSFKFNDIEQPNRNRLLARDRSVDGIKTGFTNAAGYCLVASALRDDMRLISVVLGTDSDEARMRESQKLLSYGFRYFQTQSLYAEGVTLKTAEVWYGQADQLNLGLEDAVTLTLPRGRYEDLKAETDVTRIVKGPIAIGDELGEIRISLDDEVVYRAPLVALDAVEEAGIFKSAGHGIYLLFSELMN